MSADKSSPVVTYYIVIVWGVRYLANPCPICTGTTQHPIKIEVLEGEYVAKCIATALIQSTTYATYVEVHRVRCRHSGVMVRDFVVGEYAPGKQVDYPICPHFTFPIMSVLMDRGNERLPEARPAPEPEGSSPP